MFPVIKTLSVSVQPKGRTIRKLMGGGQGTKKYSRKGKLNEKNSCTPINPEKYARYGLKKNSIKEFDNEKNIPAVRTAHVYGKRQKSDSSWEFLKIENEQINTAQNNSYGWKIAWNYKFKCRNDEQ